MILLPHLAGRVFDTPLLIARAKLDTIMGILAPRFRGEAFTPAQIAPQRSYDVTPEGIAVIPLFGTLVRRAVGLEAQSGLTSYASLGQQLAEAVADPKVKAILLDVDSPGGEAGGVFDLADQILAARQKKPIYAVANEEAFSAAYAIAAAASKVYVSRTGGVGSIGVIAVHLDQSQAEADAGLKYTAIYAGARKNDLSPHEPLSDPARASLQTEVDRVYEMFVATVARARGLAPDAVKATEAGLFFGADSVAAGLADKIGTFDDALADLRSHVAAQRSLFIPPRTSTLKRKAKTMNEPNPHPATEAPDAPATETPMPDIDAITAQAKAEARKETLAYVSEITQLCQLAGMPEKATDFIARATPSAEVRKALLTAKAVTDEATSIAGQIPASNPNTTGKSRIDTAAIYASRNNPKAQSRL